MAKQKFFRGHRVKVADKMPNEMRHFTGGCEAIVVGSYRDEYGGSDHFPTYDLLIFEKDEWNQVAWYPEELLTLVCANRDTGEKIIQKYNEGEHA